MSLAACAAGFLLDFIFGDPVWLYHPVRLIGKGIAFGERQLRKLCSRRQRQGSENEQTDGRALVAAGAILWVCVAGLSFLIPLGVLMLAQKIHPAAVRTGDILVLSDRGCAVSVQRERESV